MTNMHRANRKTTESEITLLCDPAWERLDRERVGWTWVDKEVTCPGCLDAISRAPPEPKPTPAERASNKALARAIIRRLCPLERVMGKVDEAIDADPGALWLEAVLHEHVVKMRGMT